MLSLGVKRAGFRVAAEVTHSLVNVVDVAALLLTGPIGGAIVAVISTILHVQISFYRRGSRTWNEMVDLPLFDGAVKVLTALAAINGQLGSINIGLTAVEEKVNSIDARLAAVEEKVSAIDTRLTAVEVKVGAVEGRLTALEQKVDALEEKVDARLRETRPIWEAVLERLNMIDAKFDACAHDMYEMRGEINLIKKRVPPAA